MADVILSLPVKGEFIDLVTDAFKAYSGQTIGLNVMVRGTTPPRMQCDNINFSYPIQQEGETTKAFGERVLKALVTGLVKCYRLGIDSERYRTEISAVKPAAVDIPEIIS